MATHMNPSQRDHGYDIPAPQATPMLSVLESDPLASPRRKRSGVDKLLSFVVKLVALVAFVFVIFTFVVGFGCPQGASMLPSVHDGDLVCFMRLDRSYEVGDIVAYRKDGALALARVVAVATDEVSIAKNVVSVNGAVLDEPYKRGKTKMPEEGAIELPVKVHKNEIFVLFDNRSEMGDSRTMGCLSEYDTLGTVFFLLRPQDSL